jgi:hypothetical protein
MGVRKKPGRRTSGRNNRHSQEERPKRDRSPDRRKSRPRRRVRHHFDTTRHLFDPRVRFPEPTGFVGALGPSLVGRGFRTANENRFAHPLRTVRILASPIHAYPRSAKYAVTIPPESGRATAFTNPACSIKAVIAVPRGKLSMLSPRYS